MLNINTLKNADLDNIKSDNVVEFNNSDKSNRVVHDYKIENDLTPSQINNLSKNNDLRKDIINELSEDLTPSQIIDSKTVDCLPIHAEKKTIFTPEIRQLSNGSTVESVEDWNILAEDIDADSNTFGEYVHSYSRTYHTWI